MKRYCYKMKSMKWRKKAVKSACVDESCGPVRTLRDVWIVGGQRKDVDHQLPTLSSLSPTSFTGIKQQNLYNIFL